MSDDTPETPNETNPPPKDDEAGAQRPRWGWASGPTTETPSERATSDSAESVQEHAGETVEGSGEADEPAREEPREEQPRQDRPRRAGRGPIPRPRLPHRGYRPEMRSDARPQGRDGQRDGRRDDQRDERGGGPVGAERSGPERSRDERSRDERSRDERSGDERSDAARPRDERGARRPPGPPHTPRGPRPPHDRSRDAPRGRHEAPSAPKVLADVDECELTIEKLVFGGDGLGRVDGVPVFVPRAAPGDRLRVRVNERHTKYARAEIVDVLEPGPGRREPPCPVFARCGGCDLQHLTDEAQLRAKVGAVAETLRRIGRIDASRDIEGDIEVVPGTPFGYRLRTQVHVATTERGREVGYFERGSHDLVAVDACPILVPELEALLPALPQMVRDSEHSRVDLAAGDDGAVTASPPVEGLPQGEITIAVDTPVGPFTYRFDARCFFQGHRDLLPELVRHVLGDHADADGTAIDLYAGVGLFSLPLARRYRRVVAVETDRIATRYARKNLDAHDLQTVEIAHVAVERWLDQNLEPNTARVVVDPPRGGLSPKARHLLVTRRPQRLTYVSCEASILARDLKQLGRRYTIESIALLDLFPQTGHLESVVQLRANEDTT